MWGHSSHLLKISRNDKFNLTSRKETTHSLRGYESWGRFHGEEVEEGLGVVWVREDALTQLDIVPSDRGRI